MQETIQPTTLEEELTPPSYEKYFSEIVDLAPNYGEKRANFLTIAAEIFVGGPTEENTKEKLDKISKFWQQYQEYTNVALRLDQAIKSPNLPKAERELAEAYLKDYLEALKPIIEAIKKFSTTKVEDRSWSESCLPIYDAIINFDYADCGFYEESITALLEVIAHKEINDSTQIMKKIAQHVILEIWETVRYYRLVNQIEYEDDDEVELDLGDTTIDDFDDEGKEFAIAFRVKNWNAKTVKENRSALLKLKRAMGDDDFDLNIEIILAALEGKRKVLETRNDETRMSNAIDVVIAEEEAFQALKNSGIIDWEPEEDEETEVETAEDEKE